MNEIPELWRVGDRARAEWSMEMAALGAGHRTRDFDTVAKATTAIAAGIAPPGLLVVAQARPGEVSSAEIDALRRLAPLVPIVQVAGSWCEGELRTGRPWRASARYYAPQAGPRLAENFLRVAGRKLPAWALPLTMTEDERFLHRMEGELEPPAEVIAGEWVCIRTTNPAMGDWLVSACRALGADARAYLPHQLPTDLEGVTYGLWDGDSLASEGDRESLRRFAAMLDPCPVDALLSFPRNEDREQAVMAGAVRVLSKPLWVSDLLG